MSQKYPMILGRNFIETLVLTLISHELTSPNLEVSELITTKLEEELCSLSFSMPMITNMYREATLKVIEELMPDVPKPDLKGCFMFEQVKNWLYVNRHIVLEKRSELLHVKDIDRQLRYLSTKISRTAIMSVFYKCSLLTIKT